MFKNTAPTIRIELVHLDEEGREEGGMIFFYVKGARIILSQTWEYRCAGNTYGPVNPDPIGEDGILEYLFSANYLGRDSDYTIKSVDGNYC